MNIHRLPHPLDLLVGHLCRTEISHRRTKDGGIHLWEGVNSSIIHLLTTLHVNTLYIVHCALHIDRSGYQRNLSTTTGTLFGQSKSHLTTRVVADKAYRVYFLISGTSSNHDTLALKVFFFEKQVQGSSNFLRVFHTSLPLQSAGQESTLGLDDMITESLQALHILLGSRMGIHIQIHSGCNEYGSLHRQIRRDEHIVGNTIGHLTQGRSRTGSYEHRIGPQSQSHMTMPRAITLREEIADNRFLRQCRQRDWRNKLLTSGRYNHLYLGSTLHQFTDNQTRLIGRNRARYSQDDFLSLQHILTSNFLHQTSYIISAPHASGYESAPAWCYK